MIFKCESVLAFLFLDHYGLVGAVIKARKEGQMNRHTGWRLLGALCMVSVAMQACAPVPLEKAEDLSLAESLNKEARYYYDQGKYAEAEQLYKRMLAIYEKVLGPEHSYVAVILNNLGRSYERQGKYAKAEPLYRRALVIFEKKLGPDHPNVVTALENMAELYKKMGRKGEAEKLEEQAKGIRSRNQ